MKKQSNDIYKLIPLTESTFHILISLVEPSHGYAVMKNVEKISNGSLNLGPATLYTVLGKLLDENVIEIKDDATESDERRKIYIITDFGKELLKNEIIRRYAVLLHCKDLFEKIGGDFNEELKKWYSR